MLLKGAIFDAAAKAEEYGPILGLNKAANKETARAGYVGLSSAWLYDLAPQLYRCPKCGVDPFEELEH